MAMKQITTGWWFEPLVVGPPLWKIWTSIGMIIPNICKNNKCSKPPTRFRQWGYPLIARWILSKFRWENPKIPIFPIRMMTLGTPPFMDTIISRDWCEKSGFDEFDGEIHYQWPVSIETCPDCPPMLGWMPGRRKSKLKEVELEIANRLWKLVGFS